MRTLFFNQLFFMVLFFPILATANAGKDLANMLDNIHTMQADFVQIIQNNSSSDQQISSGIMALQRPGKFRWEILEPSQQLIIANDINILIYNSDLNQLSKQKTNYESSSSPMIALLSGSIARLQKDFTIKNLSKTKGGDYFELYPMVKNNIFQKVALKFEQNKLISMSIVDNLGQQTHINFTNIKINIPLNKKTFIFIAPKGIDII